MTIMSAAADILARLPADAPGGLLQHPRPSRDHRPEELRMRHIPEGAGPTIRNGS